MQRVRLGIDCLHTCNTQKGYTCYLGRMLGRRPGEVECVNGGSVYWHSLELAEFQLCTARQQALDMCAGFKTLCYISLVKLIYSFTPTPLPLTPFYVSYKFIILTVVQEHLIMIKWDKRKGSPGPPYLVL